MKIYRRIHYLPLAIEFPVRSVQAWFSSVGAETGTPPSCALTEPEVAVGAGAVATVLQGSCPTGGRRGVPRPSGVPCCPGLEGRFCWRSRLIRILGAHRPAASRPPSHKAQACVRDPLPSQECPPWDRRCPARRECHLCGGSVPLRRSLSLRLRRVKAALRTHPDAPGHCVAPELGLHQPGPSSSFCPPAGSVSLILVVSTAVLESHRTCFLCVIRSFQGDAVWVPTVGPRDRAHSAVSVLRRDLTLSSDFNHITHYIDPVWKFILKALSFCSQSLSTE